MHTTPFRLVVRALNASLLLVVSGRVALAQADAAPSTPAAAAASAALTLDALVGRWDFTVDLGSRTTTGELWLFRREQALTGTLSPSGTNTLPIRSLTLEGATATMTVDTPEGPVVYSGTIEGDGRELKGIVTYHGGQRFTMNLRKRVPPSGEEHQRSGAPG